jgi:hypothetical protein
MVQNPLWNSKSAVAPPHGRAFRPVWTTVVKRSMSVIEMFRQQYSVTRTRQPGLRCNFLHIDKAPTTRHNPPQVLGVPYFRRRPSLKHKEGGLQCDTIRWFWRC